MSRRSTSALGVLDHQLLDSDGRRCGKVDDLELEGVAAGEPRVVAILTGPPAWRGRGRLGRLACGSRAASSCAIPWEEVAEVEAGVVLRKTAHGAAARARRRPPAAVDREAAGVVAVRLSELLGLDGATPSRASTSAASTTCAASSRRGR